MAKKIQEFELVIKSYTENNKLSYEREFEAFRGLHENPGIVRYFGRYEQLFRERYRYHIILERGTMDLSDWFLVFDPPALPLEILNFWKSLCSIAETIRGMHDLKYGSDRASNRYNG
jgi:hypothetical protein